MTQEDESRTILSLSDIEVIKKFKFGYSIDLIYFFLVANESIKILCGAPHCKSDNRNANVSGQNI